MIALAPAQWLLLGAAALFVGVAKTSVQNLVFFAVAAFALVLPARESTAAVVVLLVVADAVAVLHYWRLCSIRLLRRLLPYVIPGELLGAFFLSWVSDTALRVGIGVLLLALLLPQVIQLARRHGRGAAPDAEEHVPDLGHLAGGLVGTAAGFTTMAANASGPIFTWYLLLQRVDKRAFLGTGAIYFAIVNVLKIPFGLAMGLFTPAVLSTGVVLVPLVLLGTVLGSFLVKRLSQRTFDLVAVGTSAVAAAALLLPRA